jgi:hypothetical protein
MLTYTRKGDIMAWNQLLEDILMGKVITALVDQGYRIEISDQDGGGLFIYAAENGGKRPREGYKYWVNVVPGNGADFISNYTTKLETLMAPINKFAEQWME